MNPLSKKVQNSELGARLLEERNRLGMTQTQLAEVGGVSKGSQILYEKGKPFTSDYLNAVAEAGLDIIYLITGQRNSGVQNAEPRPQFLSADHIIPATGEFSNEIQNFSLVRRMELSASAGTGLVPASEEVVSHLAFTQGWLSRERIDPRYCAMVPVRGDSMAPTVPDGSLVLVNAAERFSEKDGIYAFSVEDEVFVKRVAFIKNDNGAGLGFTIISDNPAYPPKTIVGAAANQVNFAGRVRCILATIP